jgi:DNA-binding response OmpR family regulator
VNDKRILVVDDESQVRTLLRELLTREGFDVREAADGRAMWDALEDGSVALMTLDLNLAGEDGLALAREVRRRCDVPIVMISGKADDVDRIVGLELGADDYITKPFNLREVLARIRAVLRRYRSEPAQDARADGDRRSFDGWTLHRAERRVVDASGADVDLTTAEFDLLAIFVERPKRVLSRDMILDLTKGAAWSPFDRSIDTQIARLRKKIETDPEVPTLIKTVRGVGYVFTAEVSAG